MSDNIADCLTSNKSRMSARSGAESTCLLKADGTVQVCVEATGQCDNYKQQCSHEMQFMIAHEAVEQCEHGPEAVVCTESASVSTLASYLPCVPSLRQSTTT
jgi:hypothetical protein